MLGRLLTNVFTSAAGPTCLPDLQEDEGDRAPQPLRGMDYIFTPNGVITPTHHWSSPLVMDREKNARDDLISEALCKRYRHDGPDHDLCQKISMNYIVRYFDQSEGQQMAHLDDNARKHQSWVTFFWQGELVMLGYGGTNMPKGAEETINAFFMAMNASDHGLVNGARMIDRIERRAAAGVITGLPLSRFRSSPSIAGFYHVGAMGSFWKDVVHEQVSPLREERVEAVSMAVRGADSYSQS